jgi:hypothetical protein
MVDRLDAEPSKVKIEEIKQEWRLLWRGRIDDKVRAEGIANQSFSLLAVERGTIIVATRDFKALNLKDVLRSHNIENIEKSFGPLPSEGGWTKFAKTILNNQTRVRKFNSEATLKQQGKTGQQKKSGRGWLHL